MNRNLIILQISLLGAAATCLLSVLLFGLSLTASELFGVFLISASLWAAAGSEFMVGKQKSGLLLVLLQAAITFISFRAFSISPDSTLGRLPSIGFILLVGVVYLYLYEHFHKSAWQR